MAPLPHSASRITSGLLSSSRWVRASPPLPSIPILDARLHPRQAADDFVTETYSGTNSSPSPGAVVGIVLGSVAGFLLLLWTIHICVYMGKAPLAFESTIASHSGTSIITGHRHKRNSKSHSSRTHSRRHSRRKSSGHRRETVQTRPSYARPIIVDEARPRSSNPPFAEVIDNRRRSTTRPPIVVSVAPSETTTESTDSEDVVITVVEPPPPARRHSQRNSGHSQHRRSGNYRDIHPDQFSGRGHGR